MASPETENQDVLLELLESTSDPAYSVDRGGRVSGWNAAAEELLGYRRSEVVGQPCHEILRGRDVFGNPYCQPDCPVLLLARHHQPVRHFQMDLLARDGSARRVLCFVLIFPKRSGDFSIVHLLRRVGQALPVWDGAPRTDQPRLTERELEVLRLLAGGQTTRAMAATMKVTASTVRKHVENLLRKLGVGSRLEAVLVALDKRIV